MLFRSLLPRHRLVAGIIRFGNGLRTGRATCADSALLGPFRRVISRRLEFAAVRRDRLEHALRAVVSPRLAFEDCLEKRLLPTLDPQQAGEVARRLLRSLTQFGFETLDLIPAVTPGAQNVRQFPFDAINLGAEPIDRDDVNGQPRQLPLRAYLVDCGLEPRCVVLVGQRRNRVRDALDQLLRTVGLDGLQRSLEFSDRKSVV